MKHQRIIVAIQQKMIKLKILKQNYLHIKQYGNIQIVHILNKSLE